jgi:hypothetical protein
MIRHTPPLLLLLLVLLCLATSIAFVPSCCRPTPSRPTLVKRNLLQDPITAAADFLQNEAGIPPPADLPALIQLLIYRGEESVSPYERKALHPLVIPLTKVGDEYTCLLRWPTPQEGAPIPVVKTRPGLYGVKLIAQSTLDLAHRLAAEEDHIRGREAEWAASLVNVHLPAEKQYVKGAVEKVGYGFERFLFLKVGSFPDVYEFLTDFHLGKGDQASALVTAEKAYNTFNGWGQPYMEYCKLLRGMKGREQEMRDAALAALRTPLWTVAREGEDLEMVLTAARSSKEKAADKFWKLYEDERLQEIKQGKRPEQVSLDRAAFLMDAALVGANGIQGWEEVRGPLAELYREAGMTELAKFVEA